MPILTLRWTSCVLLTKLCVATWVRMQQLGAPNCDDPVGSPRVHPPSYWPVDECLPWANLRNRFSIKFLVPNETHIGYKAYEGLKCDEKESLSRVIETGVCSKAPEQNDGEVFPSVKYSIVHHEGGHGQVQTYVGTTCTGDVVRKRYFLFDMCESSHLTQGSFAHVCTDTGFMIRTFPAPDCSGEPAEERTSPPPPSIGECQSRAFADESDLYAITSCRSMPSNAEQLYLPLAAFVAAVVSLS